MNILSTYHPYLFLLSQLQYLLHLYYNRENSSMNESHNWRYFHLHLCPAKKTILQILKNDKMHDYRTEKTYSYLLFVLLKIHRFHLILVDFSQLLSKEEKSKGDFSFDHSTKTFDDSINFF